MPAYRETTRPLSAMKTAQQGAPASLRRLLSGEGACLQEENINTLRNLQPRCSAFQADASERNPQAVQRGKQVFSPKQGFFYSAISRTTSACPMGWKTSFPKKQTPRKTILAPLTAPGLVTGGTGRMAPAAQCAMPGETLFDAMLITEDKRLSLATSEEARADLLL
jgi:hypothetical protein